jgi:hypothetical protein
MRQQRKSSMLQVCLDMLLFILAYCPDSCLAVRAVNAHRKDVRDVLRALFEQAVPASDPVSRDVLTRILGNPHEDFAHPILDVATNHHLTELYSGSTSFVCIWQDATRKGANCISLLREIVTEGQELLADFIGTCCRDHFEQYILICTETFFCSEYRSG